MNWLRKLVQKRDEKFLAREMELIRKIREVRNDPSYAAMDIIGIVRYFDRN